MRRNPVTPAQKSAIEARLDALPRKPYTTAQLADEVGYVPPAREPLPPERLPSFVVDYVNCLISRNPSKTIEIKRPYNKKLRSR